MEPWIEALVFPRELEEEERRRRVVDQEGLVNFWRAVNDDIAAHVIRGRPVGPISSMSVEELLAEVGGMSPEVRREYLGTLMGQGNE